MARKREETPFNKIMKVHSILAMYVQYGDVALQGQTPQEFAADVRQSFDWLLEFRNMVNTMAALDESPARAALPYMSDDDMEAWRSAA